MEVKKKKKKGTHLNSIERFNIYKETIHNNHLNDEYTTANKIFDTILQHLQQQAVQNLFSLIDQSISRSHSKHSQPVSR
jgi:uncharacterized protein YegL